MAIVETRYGKVEGTLNNGVHGFKGIPFAAPPVGEQRWRAPLPPVSWAGVRAADDWGKQAWQAASGGEGPLKFIFNAQNAEKRDEDCLQLNIWSRGLDDANRAVLVFIHGGGFGGGTGGTPTYDGTILAAHGDVVVVTINYRVGAFGFLNLNEVTDGRIPSTGNEGLLDQVEALKWIRDNISAFGGDPGNVTIMGESAGGMSVGALLAMKPAKGLFHRAMPISGAATCAAPLAHAVEISEAWLAESGLSPTDDIDKLLALDPEVIQSIGIRLPGRGMTYQPIIDGTSLMEMPIDAVRGGSADGIPILVGTQRDEWRLFTIRGTDADKLDEAGLHTAVSKIVDDAQGVIEGYREILQDRGAADMRPISLLAAIETGRKMRMPAVALAEAMAARGQSAYQYVFTAESPWEDGFLSACHAIIIGYIFGTHSYCEEAGMFFGHGEDADALSGHLQDAVINLGKTGNPQTEALADWAAYDTQTRSTAVFNTPVEVVDGVFDEERVLWADKEAALPFGPDRQ
jgi:para-nitrobenzyl esterase